MEKRRETYPAALRGRHTWIGISPLPPATRVTTQCVSFKHQDWGNKVPQTGGLATANTSPVIFWRQRSEIRLSAGPRSLWSLQGRTLPCFFQFLGASGHLRRPSAYGRTPWISAPTVTWLSWGCSVSVPLPPIMTPPHWMRAHPKPVWPHPHLVTSAKTVS